MKKQTGFKTAFLTLLRVLWILMGVFAFFSGVAIWFLGADYEVWKRLLLWMAVCCIPNVHLLLGMFFGLPMEEKGFFYFSTFADGSFSFHEGGGCLEWILTVSLCLGGFLLLSPAVCVGSTVSRIASLIRDRKYNR